MQTQDRLNKLTLVNINVTETVTEQFLKMVGKVTLQNVV